MKFQNTLLALGLLGVCTWAMPSDGRESSGVVRLISTNKDANVFVVNQDIVFSAKGITSTNELNCSIRDWRGNVVAKDIIWSLQTMPDLTLKGSDFAKGYYTLTAEDNGREVENISFVIIADSSKRETNKNGFFAIDTAQSWLAAFNPHGEPNSYELATKLSAKLGVSMVRDRLSWGQVYQGDGKYDYMAYKYNSNLLKKYNINMLGMFHDSPEVLKKENRSLPDDLFEVYKFCYDVSRDFKGEAPAWEFWNEPNAFDFCYEPVWDYSAAMKAAYLGFKAQDESITVLPGGVAEYPMPPVEYPTEMFRNGAAYYMDAFNFHAYMGLPDYPLMFGSMLDILRKFDAEDLPIWVTENGAGMEGTALWEPMRENAREHAPSQERMLAESIVKNNIFIQNYGIVRNFTFVLMPYNERNGNKSWGMLRFDHNPKMIFAAFANVIEKLDWGKLAGEIELSDEVRAFLYDLPSGAQTLVYWRIDDSLDMLNVKLSPVELARYDQRNETSVVKLPLSAQVAKNVEISDMMGASLGQGKYEDGQLKLEAERYPRFVTNLKGLQATIKPRPAVLASSREAIDKTVVLRIKKVSKSDDDAQYISKLSMPLKNKDEMQMELYNFSKEVKKGRLVNNSSLNFVGIPDEIEINPMSKTVISFTYNGSNSGLVHDNMEFGGIFNDKKISQIHVPVFIQENLYQGDKSMTLPLTDLNRWSNPRPERQSVSVYNQGQEKVIRFEMNADGKQMFETYPEFYLNDNESLANIIGCELDVRCDTKLDKASFDWFLMGMADGAGIPNNFVFDLPGKEWKRIYLSFEGKAYYDGAAVNRIRFGMKTTGKEDQVTLEVKNIVFFKAI